MRLTRLELRVMDALWATGAASIREVHEALPAHGRPAYTTVQTVIYRLETKRAVRRVKKIGNANVFEASVSKTAAERRLVDDLLDAFGGRVQPVIAALVDTGQITSSDLDQARARLRELERAGQKGKSR
jgi:BlaI family penicillinase repressor